MIHSKTFRFLTKIFCFFCRLFIKTIIWFNQSCIFNFSSNFTKIVIQNFWNLVLFSKTSSFNSSFFELWNFKDGHHFDPSIFRSWVRIWVSFFGHLTKIYHFLGVQNLVLTPKVYHIVSIGSPVGGWLAKRPLSLFTSSFSLYFDFFRHLPLVNQYFLIFSEFTLFGTVFLDPVDLWPSIWCWFLLRMKVGWVGTAGSVMTTHLLNKPSQQTPLDRVSFFLGPQQCRVTLPER